MPVYGDGQNIRDWLYVEDHVSALYTVVNKGMIGETYNIGGHNEITNIKIVNTICEILDQLVPLKLEKNENNANLQSSKQCIKSYKNLITFVHDRPGHDFRYAINASKIQKELNWLPKESFKTGIKKTIEWYLNNINWCKNIEDKNYKRERLGIL